VPVMGDPLQRSVGLLTCAACGTRVPRDARFCRVCGTPTSPAPAPSLAAVAAARGDGRWTAVLRGLFVGVVVATLLVGGGTFLAMRLVSSSSGSRGGQMLAGSLDLLPAEGKGASNYSVPRDGGTDCVGQGTYSDVRPGMPIRVEDETGKLIGQGKLGVGETSLSIAAATQACSFTFTVPNLPPAEVYSVAPGTRKAFSLTREDLDAAGWHVTLTLGP
jgi:hypothetical protein